MRVHELKLRIGKNKIFVYEWSPRRCRVILVTNELQYWPNENECDKCHCHFWVIETQDLERVNLICEWLNVSNVMNETPRTKWTNYNGMRFTSLFYLPQLNKSWHCVITTKYRMKCIVCWFYHLEKVTNNCLNEFTIRFSRKLITKIRKIPAMFLERL